MQLQGRDALLCQIWSKLVKWFLRYHDFLFFKMAAAAILDFRNSQILLAEGAEMHHHAKFNESIMELL